MSKTIALLLLLGAATAVGAQTPPVPPAPSGPESPPPPEDPALPVPTRVGPEYKIPPQAPRWVVTMGILGDYDSNVAFDTASASDYGGSFRAKVVRRFQTRRDRFNVSLGGSAYAYSENQEQDNLNGNAEVGWTRELSARNTFNMSGYGTYENTATQEILTDVGIQLPRTQSQGYGGAAGFVFKVGHYGSLRLGGRYSRLAFEDPTLVDNQTVDANMTLLREVGRLDDMSLSYTFLRNEDDGEAPLQHHSAEIGWRRTLTPNLSLTVSAGITYSPLSEGSLTREWHPQGGLRLNGVWRRTTMLAEVRQTVTPAYGLGGDQLADIGTLSAVIPFGRKVLLSITGNVTWARELGLDESYFSQEATVSVNWKLFKYVGLGAGYTYRRSDPEFETTVSGHKTYCGFTYVRP
jgi:hypothetical protein